MTKVCLLRQTYFCYNTTFVATNICCDNIIFSWQNFCHDKLTFIATNMSFVVTKVCLSWQNICHGKHSGIITSVARNVTMARNITLCVREYYLPRQGMLLCQWMLLIMSSNRSYFVKEYYCNWTLLPMSSNRSYHVKECHFLCKGVLHTTSRKHICAFC